MFSGIPYAWVAGVLASSIALQGDDIVIRAVGDDLIHSPVYSQCLQEDGTYDFDKIFENVKTDIESADIAIINQETIMISDYSQISSYPMFGTPWEIGHAISDAGFDVVTHATNHTMDKGIQGVLDTVRFWDENYPEMMYLGVHDSPDDSDVSYMEVNDVKFSFVNYTYGLNGLESRRRGNEFLVDMLQDGDVEQTMAEAKANSDFVIALLHLGDEYVYKPSAYAKQQVNRFIDLGADLVICAHPHVLEPYGIVTTESGNSALVYYSLGNFVSSQTRVPRVLGGMAEIVLRRNITGDIEIADYSLIPLVTHQSYRNYTTYRLDEYPDELASGHNLVVQGLTKSYLYQLFNDIVGS